MADNNKAQTVKTGSDAAEEGYRAAKLIRNGLRELERQYNTKKTRKQR